MIVVRQIAQDDAHGLDIDQVIILLGRESRSSPRHPAGVRTACSQRRTEDADVPTSGMTARAGVPAMPMLVGFK